VRAESTAPFVLEPRILTYRARDAIARLCFVDPDLEAMLETYFQAQDAWPVGRSYLSPPAAVQAMQDAIGARYGPHGLAAFQKAALLEGLRRTRVALQSHDRWPDSLPWFDDSAVRILTVLDDCADDTLTFSNDVFAKSMALATGRMWHGKATLVEPRMGIARRTLYGSSIPTALRALRLRWQLGGFLPMYEIHLYDYLLHWFSEDGWADCYRMIARALARDPQARGLFGETWFFDPEMARVSPRLAYLHRFPAERGAVFLKVRTAEGHIRMALAKSGTRRRMYNEGTYRPQQYLMVWTRKSMLNWLSSGAE
jgi:hypothetical protein